jgi:hypothetical protein
MDLRTCAARACSGRPLEASVPVAIAFAIADVPTVLGRCIRYGNEQGAGDDDGADKGDPRGSCDTFHIDLLLKLSANSERRLGQATTSGAPCMTCMPADRAFSLSE